MGKGQGSLEYLLIFAAILAIAVVVVVVANSMLSTPSEQNLINEEKYEASVVGVELIGYNKLYTGHAETFPTSITYRDVTYATNSPETPIIHLSAGEFESAITQGIPLVSFNLGKEDFRATVIEDPNSGQTGLLLEGYPVGVNPPPNGGGFS